MTTTNKKFESIPSEVKEWNKDLHDAMSRIVLQKPYPERLLPHCLNRDFVAMNLAMRVSHETNFKYEITEEHIFAFADEYFGVSNPVWTKYHKENKHPDYMRMVEREASIKSKPFDLTQVDGYEKLYKPLLDRVRNGETTVSDSSEDEEEDGMSSIQDGGESSQNQSDEAGSETTESGQSTPIDAARHSRGGKKSLPGEILKSKLEGIESVNASASTKALSSASSSSPMSSQMGRRRERTDSEKESATAATATNTPTSSSGSRIRGPGRETDKLGPSSGLSSALKNTPISRGRGRGGRARPSLRSTPTPGRNRPTGK